MSQSARDSRDRRPQPDPTTLTTEQLHREVASLQELLETKIQAHQESVDLQFDAVDAKFVAFEKAQLKAEEAANKEGDATHATLTEQDRRIAQLVPRAEVDAKAQAVSERVSAVERRLDRGEGTSRGMEKTWGFIVAAVMVAGAIVAIIVAFG